MKSRRGSVTKKTTQKDAEKDESEQSRRFVEAAKSSGASDSQDSFEEMFKKLNLKSAPKKVK